MFGGDVGQDGCLDGRRTSLSQDPASGSPYTILLGAVQSAITTGALTTTNTFGAEQIAYTIWATVHGMAVLEQTHLRGFDADFPTVHREALGRLLHGLAAVPPPRAA